MRLKEVLKIADVMHHEISEELKAALDENDRGYTDNILNEHLYNVGNFVETQSQKQTVSTDVLEEAIKLQTIMNENDCAYVRLVLV